MAGGRARIAFLTNTSNFTPGDILPCLPGASNVFVVAVVEPPRDLILTVPGPHGPVTTGSIIEINGTGAFAVDRSRPGSRLAGSRWQREAHTVGQRLVFIEYVYRLLGRLPNSWLIAIAGLGHRFMEARHMRGIKHRAEASNRAA